MLADALELEGATVVRVREPGGTPTGERIRELLLDADATIGAGRRGAAVRGRPRAAGRPGDPPGAGPRRDGGGRPLHRLVAGLPGRRPRARPGRGAEREPARHRRPDARPDAAAGAAAGRRRPPAAAALPTASRRRAAASTPTSPAASARPAARFPERIRAIDASGPPRAGAGAGARGGGAVSARAGRAAGAAGGAAAAGGGAGGARPRLSALRPVRHRQAPPRRAIRGRAAGHRVATASRRAPTPTCSCSRPRAARS